MEGITTLELLAELRTVFHGQLLTRPNDLRRYSRDASIFAMQPELVAIPGTAADLENLVQFVRTHAGSGLSLTARAAGTDMSGGPLSDSIVVDMTKLNRIISVTPTQAVAEPGVYYRDFEKATLRAGGWMPSYPASRELCTIGGMVANNAGGEKSLTYGKTERFVKALKVLLADGHEYAVKPLRGASLKAKLATKSFDGRLANKTHRLITKNWRAIDAARPRVSKNSTGYNLWNIWNPATGVFDLTQLFVGSQGTLGLVSEITFRLVKPQPHSRLVVIFLKDLSGLAAIVQKILTHTPESFESYDHHTLDLALKYAPEFAAQLGAKNVLDLARSFLPELAMLLTSGKPQLVLLAEFTDETESEVLAKATAAQASLADLECTSRITASAVETKKYWLIRRESFNLLRHHLRTKHTAPFIDDVVVEPQLLPTFLPELEKVMADYQLTYTIAGHIGNGNFHIIPLMDFDDPKTKQIIPELSKKVFDLVFRYHGSMSGEHNDGLIRSPYLRAMYGPEVYGLFEQIKQIWDPKNIFNPGKKIGTTVAESMTHFAKYQR